MGEGREGGVGRERVGMVGGVGRVGGRGEGEGGRVRRERVGRVGGRGREGGREREGRVRGEGG